MTYEEYKKDYEKEYYNSFVAEYKRTYLAKYNFRLFFENEKEVLKYMIDLFLKENQIDLTSIPMFPGQSIGKNQNAFISKIDNNCFAFTFKKNNDFYDIEVSVKKVNKILKCSIFKSVKRRNTILGLNGTLGKYKFAFEHRKQSRILEQKIKNHFNLE